MSVAQLEQWRTLAEIAQFFGCGKRWIEYRAKEGMPSALIAGKRKFRASECEDWLRKEGHIRGEDE